MFRDGRTTVRVAVKGRLACTSFEMLHDAAIAGLGVARVPEIGAIEAITHGSLERLLQRFEPPEAPLHVLYPSNRHLAPKVRVFIDALKLAFAEPPWRVRPRKAARQE